MRCAVRLAVVRVNRQPLHGPEHAVAEELSDGLAFILALVHIAEDEQVVRVRQQLHGQRVSHACECEDARGRAQSQCRVRPVWERR